MMAAGRPTTYDPKYCQMLAEALNEGVSIKRFCRNTRIARSSFYEWIEKHKEFADTLHSGEYDRDACWEEIGINNLTNKDFNVPLYKFLTFLSTGICEKREQDVKVTATDDTVRAVRRTEENIK